MQPNKCEFVCVSSCLWRNTNETYVGQKNILIDSWAYRINEPNASPNLVGTVTTCHISGFSVTTAAAAVTIAKHSVMLLLPSNSIWIWAILTSRHHKTMQRKFLSSFDGCWFVVFCVWLNQNFILNTKLLVAMILLNLASSNYDGLFITYHNFGN